MSAVKGYAADVARWDETHLRVCSTCSLFSGVVSLFLAWNLASSFRWSSSRCDMYKDGISTTLVNS